MAGPLRGRRSEGCWPCVGWSREGWRSLSVAVVLVRLLVVVVVVVPQLQLDADERQGRVSMRKEAAWPPLLLPLQLLQTSRLLLPLQRLTRSREVACLMGWLTVVAVVSERLHQQQRPCQHIYCCRWQPRSPGPKLLVYPVSGQPMHLRSLLGQLPVSLVIVSSAQEAEVAR